MFGGREGVVFCVIFCGTTACLSSKTTDGIVRRARSLPIVPCECGSELTGAELVRGVLQSVSLAATSP